MRLGVPPVGAGSVLRLSALVLQPAPLGCRRSATAVSLPLSSDDLAAALVLVQVTESVRIADERLSDDLQAQLRL